MLIELRETLSAHANPAKAREMAAYLKDRFSCFGIMNEPRKALCKPFQEAMKQEPWPVFVALARECWAQPEREFHYFAMEMLLSAKRKWDAGAIDLFEWMIVHQSWWDSVDAIASNMVGPYFLKWPAEMQEKVNGWNATDNMWLVRTSIIFQLKHRDAADFELLKQMIAPHTGSSEFFIQKAIGWALRQYARTDAEAVIDYVASTPMANLSKREAMKHLGN